MGTFYTNGATRRDIIDYLRKGTPYRGLLASCIRGNILYTVEENTTTLQRFIGVYKLVCVDREWGYKPMDESMYPYYFSCPIKYFTMVICPNSQAAKWRAECIQMAQEKKLLSCAQKSARAKYLQALQASAHLQIINIGGLGA
jgi:hypothetical protein